MPPLPVKAVRQPGAFGLQVFNPCRQAATRLVGLLQALKKCLPLGFAAFQLACLGLAVVQMLTGFGDQPLVVAVQAGQFVLAHRQALLQLADFHLQLLHLCLVAALLLFALLAAGLPVVFQRLAGMAVLFLQRVQLGRPVGEALTQCLLALLQAGAVDACLLQGVLFLGERRAAGLQLAAELPVLALQLANPRFGLLQALQVSGALLGQCRTLLGHRSAGFAFQTLCQLGDQRTQFLAQGAAGNGFRGGICVDLLQIAVNGRFRAGIAQLDAYRIDARVLAPGGQCPHCLQHHCLVDPASGHQLLRRFRTVLHTDMVHTNHAFFQDQKMLNQDKG